MDVQLAVPEALHTCTGHTFLPAQTLEHGTGRLLANTEGQKIHHSEEQPQSCTPHEHEIRVQFSSGFLRVAI